MVTDNKKYDPIIIPLIRKYLPTIIAQQIAGVQPMTGNIFKSRLRYNGSFIRAETDWKDTFVIWPRKTITGRWVYCKHVFSRQVWRWYLQEQCLVTEYANAFELINAENEQ